MPNHRLKIKREEIIRQHVEKQVHPIAMDQPAGNYGVDILTTGNGVRMQHHAAVQVVI